MVSSIVALIILTSIALNTFLALRQTSEENSALAQQNSADAIKNSLDSLQQDLLFEHEQLYSVIGMRPFYKRAAYIFPLAVFEDDVHLAQRNCDGRPQCVALLDELQHMIQGLGNLSNTLAMRAMLKPGSVSVSAPLLGELDARFFETLQKIGEIRLFEDRRFDRSVDSASIGAKQLAKFLPASAVAASFLLLALLLRNARTNRSLRAALNTADSNRQKYERLFLQNPLPVWIVDDESARIVAVNQVVSAAFGYGESELRGMSVTDLRLPNDGLNLPVEMEGQPFDANSAVGIWPHRTKSGDHRMMVVRHLKTDFDGRKATMCVMHDITEQLEAQVELSRSKQMLESVLDTIPTGIAWKDASHRYVGGNEIYARDAGLASRLELAGLTDSDLRWGDDPAAVRAEDTRIMSGELTKRNVERRSIAADGTTVWISETKLPLADVSGKGVGVLTSYENITARRKAQLALRLHGRAIDASTSGIVIAESRGATNPLTYVNRAFEKLTGLVSADVIGTDLCALFKDEDGSGQWSEVQTALRSEVDVNVTLHCRRKDGTLFWNNVLVAPVPDSDGEVTHHVAIMSDVTAVIEHQQELRRQACFDSLTGLPNRTLLEERLASALQDAALRRDAAVYVIFLDLDRFKEVNDSLGHRIGDALLSQVAKRLQQVVDTAGTVTRYGGDEFIIVADNVADGGIQPLLDGLIAAMTEPMPVVEHELFVGASLGVSVFPGDGTDADSLIRNADAAMYLAKENGRCQYQFYRAELSEAAAARLRLSTRLRRAVKNRSLKLKFQPQIDMSTGEIVGAEALLRWTDEELGVVSPSVFIPIAEETGLIRTLGEWVLHEACIEGANWNRASDRPVRVSVNVSASQFTHCDLPGQVRDALRESGLAPGLLELEVTESALIENVDHAARVFAQLSRQGVRLAIDDFGTGYSSLSYLKRFRLDRIKIDRDFVSEIGQNRQTEAITLAIIAMAKALRFDVIAEGVETVTHRDFLLRHGCAEAQGFLYSAAVSSDAVVDMIRAGGRWQHAAVPGESIQ